MRFFRDRTDAGRRLAAALAHLRGEDPVVLALPRGGVPVGFEIARALGAPLDLVLVRKIGAPFQPELAVGAVANGGAPELVVNEDVAGPLGLERAWIEAQAARQLEEIERRRALYLEGRAPVPLEGRTAIVVDDGVATGATTRAALRAVRRRAPRRLVLAVPVAAPEAAAMLRAEVDELVCLEMPAPLGAIGAAYLDFRQVEDDEVRDLLARAASFAPAAPASASGG